MSISLTVTPTVELKFTNVTWMEPILRKYLEEIYKKDVLEDAIRHRHGLVLEYFDFVFKIECSRVTSHQIVRHRIATYLQESQRYSRARAKAIVPRSLLKVLSSEDIEKLNAIYDTYIKLADNVVKREYAHYILPQFLATKILAKWNLREIVEVIIPLRLCARAQAEIRYIAFKILQTLLNVLPSRLLDALIKARLLGCRAVLLGRCPEKKNVDIKECLRQAIIDALREHGQPHEHDQADEIANAVVSKILGE